MTHFLKFGLSLTALLLSHSVFAADVTIQHADQAFELEADADEATILAAISERSSLQYLLDNGLAITAERRLDQQNDQPRPSNV